MDARSPNLDRLERMGCGDSAAGGYAAGDESTERIISILSWRYEGYLAGQMCIHTLL